MTNSPSHVPESESNNKNGDSQLSSPGTYNHTTNDHETQRQARLRESLARARAKRLAREAEATQTKRNPAGQAVAPGDQRGSRPSEQHSSRTLEGETLNGVTHPESYADAIPDVNTEKPESVRLSDSIVENVIGHADPLVVFPRWGKGDTPRSTSGDEVQFRCPTPGHTDTNPSASLNTKTGLWVCFGCEASGDIYTLGGIKFGMDEHSSELPELKRRMAADLTGKSFIEHGPYSVLDIPAVRELVNHENKERERREAEDNRALQEKLQAKELAEQQHAADLDEYMNELSALLNDELAPEVEYPAITAPDTATDGPAPDAASGTPAATTADNHNGTHPEPAETQSSEPTSPTPTSQPGGERSLLVKPDRFMGYDELLKPGTFLSEFYNECKKDTNPNDFHFFNGLAGLGLAAGRNVALADQSPVLGNLFLCFVAGTGVGKSTSNKYLGKVLEAGLPWDETTRDGVKFISNPGSGETLIDLMAAGTVVDLDNGKVLRGNVKGYLNYDELAQLVHQGSRQGSTTKTILTTMFDGSTVSTSSRTHKESIAHDPFLTVTSNIPKDTMRELFTQGEAASGFLNRFTFVTVNDTKPQSAFTPEVEPDADYLGARLAEIVKWGKGVSRVMPDADAVELVEQFFNMELLRYSPKTGNDVNPMMVRLELMFKKFMLLFAVNEMSSTLTREHVEKAIKLYWIIKPGIDDTADSIGKSAEAELEDEIVEKVTGYFRKHTEPLTAAQIWGEKLQIGHRAAKRLGIERRGFEYALRNLVSTGELDEIKPPKGDNRTKSKYKPGA